MSGEGSGATGGLEVFRGTGSIDLGRVERELRNPTTSALVLFGGDSVRWF